MGAYKDTGNGHFEISYGGRESPFAGIDSSAPDPYIAPNALQQNSFNVIELNNTLCPTDWQQNFTDQAPSAGSIVGIGDLLGIPFIVSFVLIGGVPTVTIKTYPVFPSTGGFGTIFSVTVPNYTGNPTIGSLTFKNINGVCFFSWAGLPYILQHNNVAASILTDFLGAAILNEINGRLIAADVYQFAAGVTTEFPYQIAWSAAAGDYGQFNPLVGGLVTGAGFNNLPDVEDTITGFFTTGPTGYIIRGQGITEMSPLNSGIQPFDFNHLWASHKGIGTIYPTTVSQYGSLGCFMSDTDIFTLGYEGIQTIAGKAKSFIYQNAIVKNAAFSICAGLGPIQINGEVFLSYCIAYRQGTGANVIIYCYNFVTKEWYSFFIPVAAGSIQGISLQALNQIINNQNPINTLYLMSATVFGVVETYVLSLFPSLASSCDIIFPAEEIAFLRDVTIDGIGIYFSAPVSGVITVSINNVFYTSIEAAGAVVPTNTFQYAKLYPVALPYTAPTPQLTLGITVAGGSSVTNNIQIAKVVLFGTVNPAQRPL
jgi:hypothetical protein